MKKKKKLNLGYAYPHCDNRNIGRIKSIQDGKVIANINAGHGGGDIEVPVEHCYEFKPVVNDRVALCVDYDGEVPGYFLVLRQSATNI
jgi:hypothetical protein